MAIPEVPSKSVAPSGPGSSGNTSETAITSGALVSAAAAAAVSLVAEAEAAFASAFAFSLAIFSSISARFLAALSVIGLKTAFKIIAGEFAK
jgi:hypothetical protein